MTQQQSAPARDHWARWLLETRSGGDATLARMMHAQLEKVRDRVLKYAAIAEGDTLLDVGSGDGLIAFGALDHVGSRGHVIFSDISQDLLDHTRALAESAGVADRCSWENAPADDLAVIDDASVDVVTTRSVLIYVQDKVAAFREFFRVLKSGGRVSIFEPINSFGQQLADVNTFFGFDVTPVAALADRLKAAYRERTPDNGAMMGFDERDLLQIAQAAGFDSVALTYEAEVAPVAAAAGFVPSWEAISNAPPNPLAPSLAELMREVFDEDEARRFEAHIREELQAGRYIRREARAYLRARKA